MKVRPFLCEGKRLPLKQWGGGRERHPPFPSHFCSSPRSRPFASHIQREPEESPQPGRAGWGWAQPVLEGELAQWCGWPGVYGLAEAPFRIRGRWQSCPFPLEVPPHPPGGGPAGRTTAMLEGPADKQLSAALEGEVPHSGNMKGTGKVLRGERLVGCGLWGGVGLPLCRA